VVKRFNTEELDFNLLSKGKLSINTEAIPLTKDFSYDFSVTETPLFTDNLFLDMSLTNSLSLHLFNNELEVDYSDKSYASNKGINYLYYRNYLNVLNSYSSKSLPMSYTQVLNMYRSNVEESQLNSNNFNSDNNLSIEGYSPVDNLDGRLYNTMKLRKPSKVFIAGFNAFQKVFRPRFDESRSHARVSDLSNTQLKYIFLGEKRIKYEGMLGKNMSSYYDSIAYKNSIANVSNFTSSLLNSTNIYFSNIPFIMSRVSDPIKYIWFGHQSR